jgi:putative transposase
MALRHAAHAVYDCSYHLVWTPKYRKPVLGGAVGARLRDLLAQIGPAHDIWIEEMAVAEDHVHLFCSFPPRHSISRSVGRLKSLTARAIFVQFPDLRRQLWGGEFWEDGYFARTVGDRLTGEMVRRYIRRHDDEGGAPGPGPEEGQLPLF